jgi:transcriptional repressor NrdR
MVIVKKDGTRQLFDREKIMAGLDRASEKTSISALQKEEIVARVEKALYDMGEAEVESKHVGELVMQELAQLDEVAYVRFASVYRHFKDIKSFEIELETIKNRLP